MQTVSLRPLAFRYRKKIKSKQRLLFAAKGSCGTLEIFLKNNSLSLINGHDPHSQSNNMYAGINLLLLIIGWEGTVCVSKSISIYAWMHFNYDVHCKIIHTWPSWKTRWDENKHLNQQSIGDVLGHPLPKKSLYILYMDGSVYWEQSRHNNLSLPSQLEDLDPQSHQPQMANGIHWCLYKCTHTHIYIYI